MTLVSIVRCITVNLVAKRALKRWMLELEKRTTSEDGSCAQASCRRDMVQKKETNAP